MDIVVECAKLVKHYEQGFHTQSRFLIFLFSKLKEAQPEDSQLLLIINGLPTELRTVLSTEFRQLAEADYHFRWYAMEDPRTTEEAEEDARQMQLFLPGLHQQLQAMGVMD